MFDFLRKMLGFKAKPATFLFDSHYKSEAAKHAESLLSRSDFDLPLIVSYLQSELNITKEVAEDLIFDIGFKQVEVFTQKGVKVDAIKLLRKFTGTGLREAKGLVDELESVLPTGCTSFIRTKARMYRDKR